MKSVPDLFWPRLGVLARRSALGAFLCVQAGAQEPPPGISPLNAKIKAKVRWDWVRDSDGQLRRQDVGYTRVEEQEKAIGWLVDATPILMLHQKDMKKRSELLEAVSEWLIRRRFSGGEFGADLQYQARSLAAFLNVSVRRFKWMRHCQIYFVDSPLSVFVNQYAVNGGVVQLVGKFESSLSGDLKGAGLTVYRREKDGTYKIEEHFAGPDVEESLTYGGLISPDKKVEEVWVSRMTYHPGATRQFPGDVKKSEAMVKKIKSVLVWRKATLLEDILKIAAATSPVKWIIDATPLGDILPEVSWKPPCSQINLQEKKLFPSAAIRDQGNWGTCHLFASVGLLESSLKRAYGVSIPLSEEDLYSVVQDNGVNPTPYDGGFYEEDIAAAQKHGVATRRAVAYRESDGPWPKVEPLINDEQAAELGIQAPETPAEVKGKSAPVDVLRERETIRQAIGNFKLRGEDYSSLASNMTRKKDMIENLCAGKPLAISINMKHLREWDSVQPGSDWRGKDKDFVRSNGSMHAVSVIGFEPAAGEAGVRFIVRNSWGGANPFLGEEDLWRVERVAWMEVEKGEPSASLKKLSVAP